MPQLDIFAFPPTRLKCVKINIHNAYIFSTKDWYCSKSRKKILNTTTHFEKALESTPNALEFLDPTIIIKNRIKEAQKTLDNTNK